MTKPLRYKPNDMELKAIQALALSGSACIRCVTSKVARYQQTRLRTMLTNSGLGSATGVGRREKLVYAWLFARYHTPHVNEIVLNSINSQNTFIRVPHSMRDSTADAEQLLARFTIPDKPKVTLSKVAQQVLDMAKSQLKAKKIDQETYDKILKQYGLEE